MGVVGRAMMCTKKIMFFLLHGPKWLSAEGAILLCHQSYHIWKPNDPCLDWKRPCFGGAEG